MQMVADRKHRQSDRSRKNSSWMEISLQKERRGKYQDRAEIFGQGKILLKRYYSTSTTTLPQNVSCTQRGVPCVSILIREGTRGPFPGLKRSCFYCSPCPFLGSFLNDTLTSGLVVWQWWFNFIYFLLMVKAGQQLLQG